MDYEGHYLHHRLCRPACLDHGYGPYIKDLSRLGRDLKDVIIVEDIAEAFQLQPNNGLLIPAMRYNEKDGGLEAIWQKLVLLKDVEDVQVAIPALLKGGVSTTRDFKDEDDIRAHQGPLAT